VANLPISLIHNGQLLAERIRGAFEENDPWYCVVADTISHLPFHALYVGTIPLLEGFGGPTWDIMKRRAQLAVADQLVDVPGTQNATFQRVMQSVSKSRKTDMPTYNEGAVRTLLKVLRQPLVYQDGEWKWGKNGVPVELTLVGHSMGSMVINRVLSLLEGVHRTERTPVEHIVYLAPAAPVDELDRLAIPYVEQANVGKAGKLHPTQLWLFELNRRDETSEISWKKTLGLLPRGSLLTWIDTFLERETTWGQSSSGRTWNLLHAYGLEPIEPPPHTGTCNCFTSYWNPADGLPPEHRPLTAQFRERRLEQRSVHRLLQDKNLLKLYDSPRRIGADNVPGEHGDFTTPAFFFEALCQVATEPFRTPATCDRAPGLHAIK
jgi:pimeloyl-ACP methyl ester carboxylesterase